MTGTMNHEQAQSASDEISQLGCIVFNTHGYQRIENTDVRIQCYHPDSEGTQLCVGHSATLPEVSMTVCPLGIDIPTLVQIIANNSTP